jgi:hypothetical protein
VGADGNVEKVIFRIGIEAEFFAKLKELSIDFLEIPWGGEVYDMRFENRVRRKPGYINHHFMYQIDYIKFR